MDNSTPWESEPDREEFVHAGMQCFIRRIWNGALCGYVALPPGHPLFEIPYPDIPDQIHRVSHGGLTFSGRFGKNDPDWWLGFDCAHIGDYTPWSPIAGLSEIAVYRDLPYVRAKVRDLAEALSDYAPAMDEARVP